MMSTLSPAWAEDRNTRVLLLASLALNLFLIGAGGAVAVRHYIAPSPASTVVDRSVSGRIERITATLPVADADLLRDEFRKRATAVESVQTSYRQAQDRVREALRAEPFQPAALRSAMDGTRTARQGFDQSLQELIAAAAARMSPAGRAKLADWPPRPRPETAR